jgi:hypothetical protein
VFKYLQQEKLRDDVLVKRLNQADAAKLEGMSLTSMHSS